jgi:LysR family transcriptional regulator, hca operon transcriptional activator
LTNVRIRDGRRLNIPADGDVPTIDRVVGYNKANAAPIPKLFLSRIDDLIARVSSNRPTVKP